MGVKIIKIIVKIWDIKEETYVMEGRLGKQSH